MSSEDNPSVLRNIVFEVGLNDERLTVCLKCGASSSFYDVLVRLDDGLTHICTKCFEEHIVEKFGPVETSDVSRETIS